MRTTVAIILAVASFSLAAIQSQEIPKGVTYKRASDATNSAAADLLAKSLANPSPLPEALFDSVAVCGPMLWKALKPTADKTLLDTLPMVSIIPPPDSVTVESRRIRTVAERQSFWQAIFKAYPALKDGKIRKAKADEISYYWAMIPYDIEEPFLTVDAGPDRFIAHFKVSDGKPTLFWFDRVDDIRLLKP